MAEVHVPAISYILFCLVAVEEVHDYFRAILCSGEVSQRALDLTTDAVDLNPANYTVWHHRRWLLRELGANIDSEMEFCRATIEDNPKNYQVLICL